MAVVCLSSPPFVSASACRCETGCSGAWQHTGAGEDIELDRDPLRGQVRQVSPQHVQLLKDRFKANRPDSLDLGVYFEPDVCFVASV